MRISVNLDPRNQSEEIRRILNILYLFSTSGDLLGLGPAQREAQAPCPSKSVKQGILCSSVPDLNPDPDSPDPHVFGPPGSGSFFHPAKIVRKALLPTAL
jgi:hypothetical protein